MLLSSGVGICGRCGYGVDVAEREGQVGGYS